MNDLNYFDRSPHEPSRRSRRPAAAAEDGPPGLGGEESDSEPPRRRGRRRRNDPEDDAPLPPERLDPDELAGMRPRGRRHRRASPEAEAAPAAAGEGFRRDEERSAFSGSGGRRSRPREEPEERGPRQPAVSRSGGTGATRFDPDATAGRRSAAAGEEADEASLDRLGLPYEDRDGEEAPASDGSPGRRRLAEQRRAEKELRRGRKKRKRRRGRFFAPAAALLVLSAVVFGGGGAAYLGLRSYFAPPDYEGSGTGEVEVLIQDGDTGNDIGQTLEDAGVVASVRAFTNELRGESSSDFRPGTYQMRAQMSAEAAVALLLDPEARVGSRVTIREGLRASQIFAEVEQATGVPVEELEAVAESPEDLGLPGYADGELEGYLFPDTYTFEPDASAEDILGRMVDRFTRVAEDMELDERAEDADLDPNEVMAIAAIIQAESGSAADMPLVSQVVYNRLDIGMELGMDSTCFYVIDEYGIALTNDQLRACEEADSGYATYGREGLPIGPIVSPGQDAITAALEPEPGDYLFFVATDPENGVTEFAETEEEFQVLVERFEQNRGDL